MSVADNLYGLQEQIYYVQCGYCSTILLVSVPISNLSCIMVTVRCGHCNSLLSVNMAKACFLPLHFISSANQQEEMVEQKQEICAEEVVANEKEGKGFCPSFCFSSDEEDYEDSVSINQVNHKPPEKKQRTPSAYNRFIKEEIKRLKIEYPNMTHKQAFSTAAKNWAHCPQSQFKIGGDQAQEIDERVQKEMPMCSEADDKEVGLFFQ